VDSGETWKGGSILSEQIATDRLTTHEGGNHTVSMETDRSSDPTFFFQGNSAVVLGHKFGKERNNNSSSDNYLFRTQEHED
jgi:hypothetical protein